LEADQGWTQLRDAIHKTSEAILGKSNKKKQPDWFNENQPHLHALLEQKHRSHQAVTANPHNPRLVDNFKAANNTLEEFTIIVMRGVLLNLIRFL